MTDLAAGVLAKTGVVSAHQGRICIQALSDAGLLLPEGYVAVPREPTDAMRLAYIAAENAAGVFGIDSGAAYRAMIQAQGGEG